MLRRNISRLTKEGALEACGRKWRSTGRLTLGGSKATKENVRDSRLSVFASQREAILL